LGHRVEGSRFFACAVKFPLKIELNHLLPHMQDDAAAKVEAALLGHA
jgi:hypothetical protein